MPAESGDSSTLGGTLGPRQASKSCAPGVSRSGPSLRQTGLEGTVNQLPGLAVRIAMSAPSAVIDSIHCVVLSVLGLKSVAGLFAATFISQWSGENVHIEK